MDTLDASKDCEKTALLGLEFRQWHFNEVILLIITFFTSDLRWFIPPISGIYWDGLVVIDDWVYPFIRLL